MNNSDSIGSLEGDTLSSNMDKEGSITDLDSESSSSTERMYLHRSNSSGSFTHVHISKLLGMPGFEWGFDMDQVGESTRKKLTDMTKRTKKTFQKLKSEARIGDREFDRLNDVFLANLSKFDERIMSKLQSSTTEKLFYAISVFLISAAGFIIGKYPEYFHILHTALFCVLMPIRFYTYFKKSFQYYLADLCYYVNLLLMLYLWGFPESKSLFISVFSLSMGTLSFAVITWRNSLVLHSIEKTTSSFIHIMPPVTMFVLVHEYPKEELKVRFPAVASIDKWNFINGIIWTSLYYTLWQVAYHYFITIKRKESIKKGKVTSFTYLKKKKQDQGIGKFVNNLPYAWMQITAFTIIQFVYQISTMIFCPIWFHNKHACGTFMVFIFVWAAYNGATFYVDIFGKRLEKEVEKLKSELVQLKEPKLNGDDVETVNI